MSNLPMPVRFADYSGKIEANLGSMRGPNTLGELLVITEVTYNEETDKTRVGFSYTGQRWPLNAR